MLRKHSQAGFLTSTAKMCNRWTAVRVAKNVSSSAHLLHKLLLLTWDMGESAKFVPHLHFSFLTLQGTARKAKPGSERGILEGLKGSCGPSSRTRTGLLPMVPFGNTACSLIFLPTGEQHVTPFSKWTCQYLCMLRCSDGNNQARFGISCQVVRQGQLLIDFFSVSQ